jgi:hypothetical protein
MGWSAETIAEVSRDGERGDDVPLRIRAEFNVHDIRHKRSCLPRSWVRNSLSVATSTERGFQLQAMSLETLFSHFE